MLELFGTALVSNEEVCRPTVTRTRGICWLFTLDMRHIVRASNFNSQLLPASPSSHKHVHEGWGAFAYGRGKTSQPTVRYLAIALLTYRRLRPSSRCSQSSAELL